MPKDERVKPIIFNYDETTTYTLDFDRESALAAQRSKLPLDDIGNQSIEVVEKLFYFSFKKNHPHISKTRTDAILKERGGLLSKEIERLSLLFQQAAYTGLICLDESELKNPKMTMEMED